MEEVKHHIEELAALGIPGPRNVPVLYPLSNHLVSQGNEVEIPHINCSGEAEWALVVGNDPQDIFIIAASDHTDRALEVHGIAWSKQSFPNFLAKEAWLYSDIEKEFDEFVMRSWVEREGTDSLAQNGQLSRLLPPRYWISRLDEAQLLRPGTVLLGGTISMNPGVNPSGEKWRVEIEDQRGNISRVEYTIKLLPVAWE